MDRALDTSAGAAAPALGAGLHCIVYASTTTRAWSSGELSDLAERSRRRNAGLDITGRLIHVGDAFVQALEGPDIAVRTLYRSITADPRHTSIKLLVDTGVGTRVHGDWSMDFVSASALPDDEAQWARAMVDGLRTPQPGDADFGVNVDTLLGKVGRSFTASAMRTTPVQPRAFDTVQRILTAGRRLALRSGERPALQAVAAAANIQLAAVYRYFSTPDDLVRMLVRLWTVAQFDRYRARLRDRHFSSFADVASDLAGIVERLLRDDLHEPGIPARIKRVLFRDYHDAGLAEQWALAGDVVAAMTRDGLDTRDPDMRARLAMAFASAGGFAKMTFLHAPDMRATAYFRETLQGYFLAALNGGSVVSVPSVLPPDQHAGC